MPGGRFDSSKTRVAPFFDYLLDRDPVGESWLPELLTLPEHGAARVEAPGTAGELLDHAWGESERALEAPASLLKWLMRNLKCPSSMKRDDLRPERQELVDRDPERIAEGIRQIESGPGGRRWYVMEGPSYPDVYLATPDAIIVIEGKRTEAGPTTSTTWMPIRLQMLRHLDGAFEIAGPREVFGFFMVEGPEDGELPAVWEDACASTLDAELIEASLPHRSPAEREVIANAFLGAVTWQRACDALGVPRTVLIDVLRD